MVRTNPIPQELVDRPFIEQVRALPARVALEAFLAAAAGFTDDPPARDAFAVVLRSLTAGIFSGGDLPRDVITIQTLPVDTKKKKYMPC